MSDEEVFEDAQEPQEGADVTPHARSTVDLGAQKRAARARKMLAGTDDEARSKPPEGRTTRPTHKAG
jgi:hypothetical protein